MAAMIVSNALVGLFAVWTVHHGCEAQGVFARTERRAWCSWLRLFATDRMIRLTLAANKLAFDGASLHFMVADSRFL